MLAKPKKSLGQNFLTDKNILRKIIDACDFKLSDIVLEIGAGQGELTGFIADRVKELYAVELDSALYQALKNKFRDYKNVRLVNQDILKLPLRRYFGRLKSKIKVVGNIPYYITTPILERLLEFSDLIDAIFMTVQKEFAKRAMAMAGSKVYGRLSCFVQYYTEPEACFLVKKGSFLPKPKVDSCFLRLKIRRTPPFKVRNERLFFKVIRAAFGQRRKTLRNSLEGTTALEKLALFFKRYNIDNNIRPEDLSLEDFANLVNL